MIGKIKSITIRPSKIIIEANSTRIKLPLENLVTVNGRVIGIRLLDRNSFIPVSLLRANGCRISIDPRLPYHI